MEKKTRVVGRAVGARFSIVGERLKPGLQMISESGAIDILQRYVESFLETALRDLTDENINCDYDLFEYFRSMLKALVRTNDFICVRDYVYLNGLDLKDMIKYMSYYMMIRTDGRVTYSDLIDTKL